MATSPALDAGRLLHVIFEDHFNGKGSLEKVATKRCKEFRLGIPKEHPASRPSLEKAVQTIEDLIEAFPLWEDKFPIKKVLAVEEPFELPDDEDSRIIWIGRPDRELVVGGRIWHEQNRGLAASMNFGTYTRLQRRSYHEHLYAKGLVLKHRKKKLKYGGTIFNLVRKLKFRTNVGKKNEETKTAAEMFFQSSFAIDLNSGLHHSVMASLRQHAQNMIHTRELWEEHGIIPAENPKLNGGYSGSSEDPFFRVLIGEVSLDDNEVFKDRQDTYAPQDGG